MEIKPSSEKFYRINYGEDMDPWRKEVIEKTLTASRQFESHKEALEEYKEATGHEYVSPDAIVLAPPDYGAKRYFVGSGEILVNFAGFKFCDKKGHPIPLKNLGYENIKETW